MYSKYKVMPRTIGYDYRNHCWRHKWTLRGLAKDTHRWRIIFEYSNKEDANAALRAVKRGMLGV